MNKESKNQLDVIIMNGDIKAFELWIKVQFFKVVEAEYKKEEDEINDVLLNGEKTI